MVPETLGGDVSGMTETMTAPEAARALVEASRYEDALAERTAGITWMVWGIATPAIFLTYAFASVLGGRGWWMSLLWIPWVVMAVATTVSLWRSAALAAPALASGSSSWFWVRLFAFTGAIWLLFVALAPEGPEAPLIIVGAMWAGMGVVNLWQGSTMSRIVSVAAGAPLVLAGALLAFADAPIEVSGITGFVVSAAAPFLAGLYQTLRG